MSDSVPFRTELRSATEAELARARETPGAPPYGSADEERLAILARGPKASRAELDRWASHPDERVRYHLYHHQPVEGQPWEAAFRARTLADLEEDVNVGILWSPLLDAMAMRRKPGVGGRWTDATLDRYREMSGALKLWIEEQESPEALEGLWQFRYPGIRSQLLTHGRSLPLSRVREEMQRGTGFEELTHNPHLSPEAVRALFEHGISILASVESRLQSLGRQESAGLQRLLERGYPMPRDLGEQLWKWTERWTRGGEHPPSSYRISRGDDAEQARRSEVRAFVQEVPLVLAADPETSEERLERLWELQREYDFGISDALFRHPRAPFALRKKIALARPGDCLLVCSTEPEMIRDPELLHRVITHGRWPVLVNLATHVPEELLAEVYERLRWRTDLVPLVNAVPRLLPLVRPDHLAEELQHPESERRLSAIALLGRLPTARPVESVAGEEERTPTPRSSRGGARV